MEIELDLDVEGLRNSIHNLAENPNLYITNLSLDLLEDYKKII